MTYIGRALAKFGPPRTGAGPVPQCERKVPVPLWGDELLPGRREGAQVRAALHGIDVPLYEQRVAEAGALASADRVLARRRRVAACRRRGQEAGVSDLAVRVDVQRRRH